MITFGLLLVSQEFIINDGISDFHFVKTGGDTAQIADGSYSINLAFSTRVDTNVYDQEIESPTVYQD
jgi:hypothetical protein